MKWTARQNYIKFEPAYEDIYCQNRMKFSLNGSDKLKLLTSLQLPPKNIQIYELNKMGGQHQRDRNPTTQKNKNKHIGVIINKEQVPSVC